MNAHYVQLFCFALFCFFVTNCMCTVLTFELLLEVAATFVLLSSVHNRFVFPHCAGTHYYTSQRACIDVALMHTQTHSNSVRTVYPRGSCCHISHYIKPCESHFVWCCYGYLLDPAGPRGKRVVLNVSANVLSV